MARRVSRSTPPFEVALLAFLAAVDGVVAVGGGVARIGVAPPVGLALLVIGALHLVAAYGLWERASYAYPLGLGVFVFGALLDLLAADPVAAALSLLNAYLLYRYRGLLR